MSTRREFLQQSIAGLGFLVFSQHAGLAPRSLSSVDSKIELLLEEPLGTVSANIYGHLTEHLGGVIYDGVWVGRDSRVPNVDGIRKDLIDEMKKIKAPVIRYPGGCFADSYDWRDGVGPSERRPRRVNYWADEESSGSPPNHKFEPNQFGTNEFVHFCKLIGSEPYLAGNVRSLPAEQFYQWVDYCNAPPGSTSLADLRAASGFQEPFNVRFWGVGNESWGCGGDFTPEEYAVEFRRYRSLVPRFGQKLSFIASGPNADDWNWTRGFFEEVGRKGPGQLDRIYGWALHHYAWNLSRGRTQDWAKANGDALNFDAVDWYELLRQGDRMEGLIEGHWQAMGETDHDHKVKLVVDEWGPWYKSGSQATPGDFLEQMPTIRDAVFSGMTLDIFNRHPEKVAMANCAQLINCLNSLFLAHEDKFVVTPVGHIFGMYAGHHNGQGVRTLFSSPTISYQRDGQPATFWGLKGSATLHDKTLFLTVVNPHVTQPRETEIRLRGASTRAVRATVLEAADIHAHNTFDQRNKVVPQSKDVKASDPFVFTFPAASVSALRVELA